MVDLNLFSPLRDVTRREITFKVSYISVRGNVKNVVQYSF